MKATPLRFDNRVAIVTGAGNGLGRAYAEFLSRLGARVVVNDLAKTTDPTTQRTVFAADEVANNLEGEAIASYDNVVNGDRIVDAAMKKWIVRDTTFARMTKQQWDDVYRVHLEGTMSVTKAAWEPMREQGYGRIVNVSSASGLYGNFGQANYAAAKLGIAGFTFTISKEGRKRNVLANVVAPLAASQMTDGIVEPELFQRLKPDTVAPVVGYLCHENCNRTGHVYEVGAGWVSRVRWQRSRGVVFDPDNMDLDIVTAHMDEVDDFESEPNAYPTSLQDSIEHVRRVAK